MPLKFATNQSLTSVTALPSSVPTDNLILISTQTASNSSSLAFTTGLDSTYDEYQFKFINIHPATNNVGFLFNMSTDSGSNYNVTKTTTSFGAYHNEADTATVLTYNTDTDLAQSTSFQPLAFYSTLSNDNDSNISGSLSLFNPSSTTYVKHFISNSNSVNYDASGNFDVNSYIAGYGNTTSAINAIQFKFSSGNIDDGIIKMYGVKKS
jgi:hypothetical protein